MEILTTTSLITFVKYLRCNVISFAMIRGQWLWRRDTWFNVIHHKGYGLINFITRIASIRTERMEFSQIALLNLLKYDKVLMWSGYQGYPKYGNKYIPSSIWILPKWVTDPPKFSSQNTKKYRWGYQWRSKFRYVWADPDTSAGYG